MKQIIFYEAEIHHDNRLQEVYTIWKEKIHLIKCNFDYNNMRQMDAHGRRITHGSYIPPSFSLERTKKGVSAWLLLENSPMLSDVVPTIGR